MPPPQCPECGRFLATAFIEQIRTEPAPCPGCDTQLSHAAQDAGATPVEPRPVPPPAATLPEQGAVGAADALDDQDETGDEAAGDDADAGDDLDVTLGDTTTPASTTPPVGEGSDAPSGAPLTPAAAAVSTDVEPEPTTAVRPPDRRPDRDPLEGWDAAGTLPAPPAEPDPVVLAIGAGAGLVLGLLLGGRRHRGLGALLGALLGAVAARLRG